MRAVVKSIANVDGSGLAEYLSTNSLKPHINKDLVPAELIELEIPGTQYSAKWQMLENTEQFKPFSPLGKNGFFC